MDKATVFAMYVVIANVWIAGAIITEVTSKSNAMGTIGIIWLAVGLVYKLTGNEK